MKTKHAIILFIFATSLRFIGTLLKLRHWPLADESFTLGIIIQTIAFIIIAVKFLTYPKVKEFMNW